MSLWAGTDNVATCDNVAALLASHFPTERFESLNDLAPSYRGKLGHQALTSTWQVSVVKGRPRSARTSRQSLIASRTFFRAFCLVEPWLTHPGIEGHSATQMPSSSRSMVTT